MPELNAAARARPRPAERAAVELHTAIHTRQRRGSNAPNVQSAHRRAVDAPWFADPSQATDCPAPGATSVTGAAVAARLRREGYDRRDVLSALPVPVLVIHAERDLLPVEASRELVQPLGASTRIVIAPDSGHVPFWEAPQRFFAIVDSFLSSPAQEWVPP